MQATFVIVGGGIAGVTCAETLAFYAPNESIILISESTLVKSVINLRAITQTLSDFEIEQTHAPELMQKYPNVTVIIDKMEAILVENNQLQTKNNALITYQYLCLCMGGSPKLIASSDENVDILGIRDTDSVANFLLKLKESREIVIVGNGGIASELVFKIQSAKVHWVIKDSHISATFMDPGASEFVRHKLCSEKNDDNLRLSHRMRFEQDLTSTQSGAALGPDWYTCFQIQGALDVPASTRVHYSCEIVEISKRNNGRNRVVLSNGEEIDCDLIVSATGVKPCTNFDCTIKLETDDDGGILVNDKMQSSVGNIYAAGDICTANWTHAEHWFPMKLWTQARQMGSYAAKAMASDFGKEAFYQDFCFELFTHTTRLFGYKVVLLGLYNGQKLGRDYEILFRMTKGVEYVKFVLRNGRLQGAVLIGDTDMEETCENLILNQIDLSLYKEDLLNPDVDIEDYFD